MTQLYTNYSNFSLPLAVWLAANDGYDLQPGKNVVSATSLLKPIKSLVLGQKLLEDNSQGLVDIADLVPSRLGTAVHTAVEVAWIQHYKIAMKNMGMADRAIDMVRINPEPPYEEGAYNVFLEQRSSKEVLGFTISGKFDIVEDGRVKDVKTTGTYNWIHGGNDEKYAWQGSIYRWLNQDIITDDYIDVEMVLTDWSALKAQVDKKYPPKRIMTRTLPLKSLAETEEFITDQVKKIAFYMDKDEKDIPACTPEELWQRPTKFAYYKDATKLTRATRVFDEEFEAQALLQKNGGKGTIIRRVGEVKFCRYCPARPICHQAETYQNQGLLEI